MDMDFIKKETGNIIQCKALSIYSDNKRKKKMALNLQSRFENKSQ